MADVVPLRRQAQDLLLYEAESAEAILRAAKHAGIPADVITEIPARLMPDGSLAPVV